MNLLGNIFGFIVNLAVILGGLACVAWFAGSLLVYCLLDRPIWEVAILLGVTLFVFIWFCVSVGRRRSSRRRRSTFTGRLKLSNVASSRTSPCNGDYLHILRSCSLSWSRLFLS